MRPCDALRRQSQGFIFNLNYHWARSTEPNAWQRHVAESRVTQFSVLECLRVG